MSALPEHPQTHTSVKTAASALRVGGFVPFTSTDYPNKLSAVVFCQGCPWRCGYCHNPHLILAQADELLDWAAIVEWLATRQGLLDGVVFSGGEPTAQPTLLEAVTETRALGFKIALHTGGAYPRRLQALLPQLDWVGFDLKATAGTYARVTGVAGSDVGAFESLTLLQQAGVPFEVRTTVHGVLTPAEELRAMAVLLAQRSIAHWVLQPFRMQGCDNAVLLDQAAEAAILDETLLDQLHELVPHIEVRR